MTRAFVSSRPAIRIDGRARRDASDALSAMLLSLPHSGSAHAELQLSNWGLVAGQPAPDYLFDDIGPGASLEIALDGGDGMQRVFDGEITAIEDRYGEGAPQRIWLAQDRLQRMARSRHSRSFEAMSADEVITSLASQAGLQVDAAVSSTTASWHQLNESDLAFALRICRRFDASFRLRDGRVLAGSEQPDTQPMSIHVQNGVLSARLICDLNHQPTASRVLGFDLVSDEETEAQQSSLSPPPPGEGAGDTLNTLGWTASEIVPWPFASSSALAREQADAAFRRMAKRFVQGEICCVGEPALAPGREILLDGVAPRLCGRYRVLQCVHRFDNATGFETRFRVCRPDRGQA